MRNLLISILAGTLLVAGTPDSLAQVRQTLPEEKPAPAPHVITPPKERWSVEARLGIHAFPKSGYVNGLKDNRKFVLQRDTMSGPALEVGVDYRVLTLVTIGGTITTYRGVLDYQDGSRFQTDVTPLMFNAKYWGFDRPRLHSYVGAGAGFVSIRRSVSFPNGTARDQSDLVIGQQLLVGLRMAVKERVELVVDDRYTFARGSRPNLLDERESGNTDDGGNFLSVGVAWRF